MTVRLCLAEAIDFFRGLGRRRRTHRDVRSAPEAPAVPVGRRHDQGREARRYHPFSSSSPAVGVVLL